MNKEEAKKRTEMLKQLREQHDEGVKATQALLKETNSVRKLLRQAMKTAPRTVPEIAAETGLPANEVLWHVIAMKKYGQVAETGLDGYYYRYTLAEGGKS
jgi:predicted Rossmann fold nucleotide-binding protein DprA/Smf involved in DNA uptake